MFCLYLICFSELKRPRFLLLSLTNNNKTTQEVQIARNYRKYLYIVWYYITYITAFSEMFKKLYPFFVVLIIIYIYKSSN